MKQIKNETYLENGKAILDEKGKEFTTKKLIEIILRNSQYENTSEQMTAFSIVNDIEKKLKLDKDFLQIEDADFTLINKMSEKYQPIKKGLVFAPFLQALKIASK